MNASINYVVYACDDNYAMQTGVSIFSLLQNNKMSRFFIYLFSDNISAENIEKIEAMVDSFGQEIVVKDLPDLDALATVKLNVNIWAKSAYLRLFFTELLPSNVEKVLWLDSDTLIMRDISEMWNINIDGYACAGVLDAISDAKKLNGFKRNESYINTGVLLINLKLWREEAIYALIHNEIIRRRGNSIDVDQSYLNCVLKKRKKILSPKYNFMMYFFDALSDYQKYLTESDYRENEIYSEHELSEALSHIAIIHFATKPGVRPWFKNASLPFSDVWQKYLKESPWEGYVLPFDNKTVVTQTKRTVKNKMRNFILCVPTLRKVFIHQKFGYWPK